MEKKRKAKRNHKNCKEESRTSTKAKAKANVNRAITDNQEAPPSSKETPPAQTVNVKKKGTHYNTAENKAKFIKDIAEWNRT